MDELPLPTARLRFAWWGDETDRRHAHALWSNAQVTAHIGGPWTAAQVDERLEEQLLMRREHGVQYWRLFRREDEAFVGCCGLRPRRAAAAGKGFEIGFHLLPTFWGQRLAPEAAASVVAHAFGPLRAPALYAGHNPQNAASRKVLLRLGFAYTHDELYAPTGLMHPTYILWPSTAPACPREAPPSEGKARPRNGAHEASPPTPSRCCGLSPRLGVGLVVVLIMATSQTASSELTKIGLASLHAPFFTMWTHTSFMLFVLPVALALEACAAAVCGGSRRAEARSASGERPATRSLREELHDDGGVGAWLRALGLRRCALVLVPSRTCRLCAPPLLLLAAGFYVFWVAANYCYSAALMFASPGVVTAIFSSCRRAPASCHEPATTTLATERLSSHCALPPCSAFVALLSRIMLAEPMNSGKVASVVLAVCGVLVLGITQV